MAHPRPVVVCRYTETLDPALSESLFKRLRSFFPSHYKVELHQGVFLYICEVATHELGNVLECTVIGCTPPHARALQSHINVDPALPPICVYVHDHEREDGRWAGPAIWPKELQQSSVT